MPSCARKYLPESGLDPLEALLHWCVSEGNGGGEAQPPHDRRHIEDAGRPKYRHWNLAEVECRSIVDKEVFSHHRAQFARRAEPKHAPVNVNSLEKHFRLGPQIAPDGLAER